MAATEERVLKNHIGQSQSPVILASVELGGELAKRNSTTDGNVHSVFDSLIGEELRYLQLKRFYVLRENAIQASYIPICQAAAHVIRVGDRSAYKGGLQEELQK